jgi:hypothetical protein
MTRPRTWYPAIPWLLREANPTAWATFTVLTTTHMVMAAHQGLGSIPHTAARAANRLSSRRADASAH